MIVTFMGASNWHQGISSWVKKGDTYELLAAPCMISWSLDNLNPQSHIQHTVHVVYLSVINFGESSILSYWRNITAVLIDLARVQI